MVRAVALAELDGLTKPNAYGRVPICITGRMPDPTLPDTEGEYSYWDHVDFVVETAGKQEMFVAILPTWGDKFNLCWGKGPEIFNEENAYTYGRFIANRYRECWNIIWMLGGDRKPGEEFTVDLFPFAGTKCVKGAWFNPRTGEEALFGILRPGEKTLVVPPTRGKGQDWVLVLEVL